MKTLYESMGAIVGFSVLTLLIQNFVSDKASQYFIALVLVSILIFNSDKIVKFAESIKGGE